jgi:hypothetical protein
MPAQEFIPGTRLCRFQSVLGRIERCPEDPCPFWEPGGAVLEGRCAFDPLDLGGRPELAESLLEIRTALERARTREGELEVWRRYSQLLDEGERE